MRAEALETKVQQFCLGIPKITLRQCNIWVVVNDNTTPLRPVADVVWADPVRVYGLALVGILDE